MKLAKWVKQKVSGFAVKNMVDMFTIYSVKEFVRAANAEQSSTFRSLRFQHFLQVSAMRYMTDPEYKAQIDANKEPVFPGEAFIATWGELNMKAGYPVKIEGDSALTLGDWFTLIHVVQKHAVYQAFESIRNVPKQFDKEPNNDNRETSLKILNATVRETFDEFSVYAGVGSMVVLPATASTSLKIAMEQGGFTNWAFFAIFSVTTACILYQLICKSIHKGLDMVGVTWYDELIQQLPDSWEEVVMQDTVAATLLRQSILNEIRLSRKDVEHAVKDLRAISPQVALFTALRRVGWMCERDLWQPRTASEGVASQSLQRYFCQAPEPVTLEMRNKESHKTAVMQRE